jgi:hypothetical protein
MTDSRTIFANKTCKSVHPSLTLKKEAAGPWENDINTILTGHNTQEAIMESF